MLQRLIEIVEGSVGSVECFIVSLPRSGILCGSLQLGALGVNVL